MFLGVQLHPEYSLMCHMYVPRNGDNKHMQQYQCYKCGHFAYLPNIANLVQHLHPVGPSGRTVVPMGIFHLNQSIMVHILH